MPSSLPSMNLVSQLFHHELNSSVAVGSIGRSKFNLPVHSHVSHLLIFKKPNPPQDTWQFDLQLEGASLKELATT